jgi:hypothetical protein
MKRPVIKCSELPEFCIPSPESLALVFKAAPVCKLGQPWLRSVDPDFAPGDVRVGTLGENLCVFAQLTDADIFTQASGPNQRLWKMGDTFEIFLRPSTQEAYLEFQIAANNQRLQLRYAGLNHVEAVAEIGGFESCMLPDGIFESCTWTRIYEETKRWFVYARIPASVVLDKPMVLAGSQWFFSFGRYDYTRGREEPIISSTSLHAEPDFHRQHEWGVIVFE